MDDNIIVNKFSAYFRDSFSCNDVNLDEILRQEYLSARPNYCGLPLMDSHQIDTELVSNVIANFKRGKAIDIDGLSAQHMQYSHLSLCVVLSKMLCSIVTEGLKRIFPIPKPKEVYSKPFTCDDFRGIAISPVLAKLLNTVFLSDLHPSSRHHLINSDSRKVLDVATLFAQFVGLILSTVLFKVTVTLCAIDLYKAFDRVNHYALFSKLMKQFVPGELLIIIERWLANCCSCVK